MFGQGRNRHPEEKELAVDAALERVLSAAEQAIELFLENPTDSRHQELVSALEEVDRQTEASDAFSESVVGSGAVGYSTKFSVIGETSANPIGEEVPTSVFQAQIALVRAAKNAAADRTEDKISTLRRANGTLAGLRAENRLLSLDPRPSAPFFRLPASDCDPVWMRQSYRASPGRIRQRDGSSGPRRQR